MFNIDKLAAVITAYKESFALHWEDEKYKWEAVRHFQDSWDIHAEDFTAMLELATVKTYNLLASGYFYPRAMIVSFAKEEPETVRSMFMSLFDETMDLEARVEGFQVEAEQLREKYDDGTRGNHYQSSNAISTYLWLRYPDQYYIYKYSEYLAVAKELESDYVPKKSRSAANMIGGFKLYDEICEQLQQDPELSTLLAELRTDSCYEDPFLKTMTIDVGFFISRIYTKGKVRDLTEWYPKDYDPGLTVEDWSQLLQDKDVFTGSSLEIMKRLKDYGGEATCTQLAIKYGKNKNFYNAGSSALARRVVKKTDCPVMDDDEYFRWWPVLYVGRYADKEDQGSFTWRLRDELAQALVKVDLSEVPLYEETPEHEVHSGYWWLNANPKIWSFSDVNVGEIQNYTMYNDNGNKRRIFQNFLDAKAGDLIIGYESNPVKQVVALARIHQEQDGESLYFEKTEGLAVPIDYADLKSYPELERTEYFLNPQGSLFRLTKGEFDFIMDMIREANPIAKPKEDVERYTKADFLNEVYMTEERYDSLVSLVRNKQNLILQGAPGVGKTFAARRLAHSMMEKKDDSRIAFIQFHQNYSYEDFIMGYKPEGETFKLTNGIFYQFCQNAANHPEDDFFFIIDEINRGNMSKIFGELLMLIERDYRGDKATLAYSGTAFSVPKNLYLIGMMNTADRSLAMIDYALRRRFSFFEMEPGFNSRGFKDYQEELKNDVFDNLVDRIRDLNREIAKDDSLGPGFRIGHSYFCGQEQCTEEWMKEVVHYDIIPMLQEYWFDDQQKLQRWVNILSGVFND